MFFKIGCCFKVDTSETFQGRLKCYFEILIMYVYNQITDNNGQSTNTYEQNISKREIRAERNSIDLSFLKIFNTIYIVYLICFNHF